MEGLEVAEVLLSNLGRTYRLDPEYYRKLFLTYEKLLRKLPLIELSSMANFLIGPFGSAYDTSKYVENGKYRYIRGQDVKPFILKDNEPRFVSQEDYNELEKYAVHANDVLVSVVGTLGNVCIVQKKDTPAIFSCKSTVIRLEKTSPVFLTTYLNSKYGKALLLRKERGAIQKGLNLDDLKEIQIPDLSDYLQNLIEDSFLKAQTKLVLSKEFYARAENILLEALGLSNWQPPTPLSYERNSKDVFNRSRLDAEHFQPKFDDLIIMIQKTGQSERLGDLLDKNARGSQPEYLEKGVVVINSKHVINGEVIIDDTNREASIEGKGLFAQYGDVLMNGTGVGTIGRTAPYLHESDALPDNHVTILRPSENKIDPVFLSVYLNSIAGTLQVEQHLHGSSGQIELYPNDIAEFVVWNAEKDFQKQIRKYIEDSFQMKRRASELLEAAKRAVEIAIESSEEEALTYLQPHMETDHE